MSGKDSIYYFKEKMKGYFNKIRPRVLYFYRAPYIKIACISYAVLMLPLLYVSIRKSMAASAPEEEEIALDEMLPMVQVERTASSDFEDTLSAIGTLKGASEVSLRFEISGRIMTFNFREGQNVREGDVIVSLDSDDVVTRIEHARSKLDSVSSQHQSAQEQYNIHQDLYRMGAIVRSRLREMELRVRSLEAEVQSARAELRMAQADLEKTVITAPSDGIMGTRYSAQGDFVTSYDEVGTFLEVENVFVEAGIIEREIQKIRQGQEVLITFDAYPDQVFRGIVDNVSRMVRGETRTLPIQIKIENPDLSLYSGMLANCRIILEEIEDAIMVPSEAIIDLGDMKVVPVVKMESEDIGEVELRKIQTGYERSDVVEITQGLSEGELIVLETQRPLSDGLRVRVIQREAAQR